MLGRFAVFCAAVLLWGCDVPQPFQHEGRGTALAEPQDVSVAAIKAEEAAPQPVNPAAPSQRHRTTLRLEPLDGLPGDGSQSLHRAMKSALERRGILVVGTGGDLVARLRMTRSQGAEGRVKMAFAWEISGADGHVIGRVDQQGEAASAEVSGPWGGLARQIADGGAEGIMQLVTKLTP